MPPNSQALATARSATLTTPDHDFVTVDMRGMKAALVARARAQRCSVSRLVRQAVGRAIGAPSDEVAGGARGAVPAMEVGPLAPGSTLKVSIRLRAEEVLLLDRGAHAAGLSRGAFVAGLVARIPVLASPGLRPELLSALATSNAVLATLARDLRRLTMLLRQADVGSAQSYRAMLDTLDGDVRRHLDLAARSLSALRPGHSAATEKGSGRRTRSPRR